MSTSCSLPAGVSLAFIVAGSLAVNAMAEVEGPPPSDSSFIHLDAPRGGQGVARTAGGQESSDGACGAGLPCDWDGDGEPDCTQSLDPATLLAGHTVQCAVTGEFTRANGLARAFVVSEGGLAVQCVEFGVQQNLGGDWPVSVNIYSGDIEGSFASLEQLGSTEVLIPDDTSLEFFTATFAEPVFVPEGAPMVVELSIADRNPAEGGDGGLLFLGSNDDGETAPTYIRAPDCGVADFMTYASIGFPEVNLVMTIQSVVVSIGAYHNALLDCYYPNDPLPPGERLRLTDVEAAVAVVIDCAIQLGFDLELSLVHSRL